MVKKTDQLKESLMGNKKQAAQTFKGNTGIYRVLAKEHGEADALMSEIEKTNGDSNRRRELFESLKNSLLEHARNEEEVFYSKIAEYSEAKPLVDQARSDHAEMETMLDELSSDGMDTDTWMSKFRTLRNAVLDHARMEEVEIFNLSSDLLENKEEKQLKEQYAQQGT